MTYHLFHFTQSVQPHSSNSHVSKKKKYKGQQEQKICLYCADMLRAAVAVQQCLYTGFPVSCKNKYTNKQKHCT